MKEKREIVYNKFDGRCAYCGDKLKRGWHIDHLLSVVRNPITNEKEFPERDNINNLMSSCPSCNIQKNSYSLENFRSNIKKNINSLNSYSTQYKFAKRYGLVDENDIDVEFYFEKFNKEK